MKPDFLAGRRLLPPEDVPQHRRARRAERRRRPRGAVRAEADGEGGDAPLPDAHAARGQGGQLHVRQRHPRPQGQAGGAQVAAGKSTQKVPPQMQIYVVHSSPPLPKSGLLCQDRPAPRSGFHLGVLAVQHPAAADLVTLHPHPKVEARPETVKNNGRKKGNKRRKRATEKME